MAGSLMFQTLVLNVQTEKAPCSTAYGQKLQNYWKTVVEIISSMVGVQVPCQPKLCILGIYPEDFMINSEQSILIDFGLLQARKMIALSW